MNQKTIDQLKEYSIPVKVFKNLLDRYPDSVWHKAEEMDKHIELFKKLKEESKVNEELQKSFDELTQGLQLIVLQEDDKEEFYAIYAKGFPLSQIKTKGGKGFAEAMEKVSPYSPLRDMIFKTQQ